jgi:hypothetical protein
MNIARMAPARCTGVVLRFCERFQGRAGAVGCGSAVAAIKVETGGQERTALQMFKFVARCASSHFLSEG